MKRMAVFALLAAAGALAGCNGVNRYPENPYRQQGKGNPSGTPADRTGGARNVPDGAGGGPGTNPAPADQPRG